MRIYLSARVWRLALGLVWLLLPAARLQSADPAASSPAGLEFFEKKIRPVFVDNCYKCHSAQSEKVKGGLLLDTREGLLKGGETGPAIVPGEPEKSLLIKAVRYQDEKLQMPPKDKKLSAEQIADLEAWVKMGAPDPRTGQPSPLAAQRSTKSHWAFQPVKSPAIPKVKNESWVQTPIDAFILAQLEAKAMNPSRPADKRTLLRRAGFDVTGLPPTPEEMSTFLADDSPEAFAKAVERLLASPRYGERWARHWLDVARYADTKGYVFEEERRYPYSYTYRDYVIRAFNEDLPFDQFIVQQIAADLLPLGEDKRPLAALGYLTLGRRFLNNQHDIIDDRIDVVTRGMMGLTVACARCHDHKYDPIPTKDYYSLYGVFSSSSEPADKPLLGGAQPLGYSEYLAERKKRNEELETFRVTKQAEALSQVRQKSGEYLLLSYDARRLGDESKAEGMARERKLHPGTAQRWMALLDEQRKQTAHPIFGPWFAFERLATNEFASKAGDLAAAFAAGQNSTNKANPLVAQALAGESPASMKDIADRYGKLFADVDKRWQEFLKAHEKTNTAEVKIPAPVAFSDSNLDAIRQLIYGPDAPANVPESEIMRLFDVPTAQKVRALRRKVEELDATHPGAPPRAMALQDNARPSNPRVFVRGNPGNGGPQVPRQFLEVLSGEKRKPFEKGSGRLELGQAVASRDNPLTARVIVNRVWMHYFGAGLVRTPSDFGIRSEPPSHPELLDYLARRFMDEGWSLKKLHRWILLSSVYQQSSENNTQNAQLDPNNQLLWKMNRRRLDFEAMRDSLLAVAGKLDQAAGGRAVEMTTEPFTSRRTIYGFVERQNLPSMFRTFDFASPDTTSPQRFFTTVPQQALFMINSPFVVEQARGFVQRPELRSGSCDEDRVKALYHVAFQRAPKADEIELGLHFLKSQEAAAITPSAAPVWQYGYGEYDESARRLKHFQPLPHFTGQAWQGGPKLPDGKLGWITLNATGGHAGNDLQHAAIRRWTAPADGTINISGSLNHESDKGDGVRGRIVSSRVGELGIWIAQNAKQETKLERIEIKKGDSVDFVTDCRTSVDSDSFAWSPTIRIIGANSPGQGAGAGEWNAKADFSGPKERAKPLTSWEKYAQVLLMSNELVFVD
jgi:mono/diheme cytochrome c family protein